MPQSQQGQLLPHRPSRVPAEESQQRGPHKPPAEQESQLSSGGSPRHRLRRVSLGPPFLLRPTCSGTEQPTSRLPLVGGGPLPDNVHSTEEEASQPASQPWWGTRPVQLLSQVTLRGSSLAVLSPDWPTAGGITLLLFPKKEAGLPFSRNWTGCSLDRKGRAG